MKLAIVNSKELGTNCWSTHRFCGGRCYRVLVCNYPEKQSCKAVASEIDFVKQNRTERIAKIEQSAKKALEQLEVKWV